MAREDLGPQRAVHLAVERPLAVEPDEHLRVALLPSLKVDLCQGHFSIAG